MVLAQSFSRSFYRNAINNGLLPVECDTDGLREGDMLRVELRDGTPQVTNETARQMLCGAPLTPIMLEILAGGGLVPYIRSRPRA